MAIQTYSDSGAKRKPGLATAGRRRATKFTKETLEQELNALNGHIATANATQKFCRAALKSGALDQQNLALDRIILLREKKW